jgi:hypothetical protein
MVEGKELPARLRLPFCSLVVPAHVILPTLLPNLKLEESNQLNEATGALLAVLNNGHKVEWTNLRLIDLKGS